MIALRPLAALLTSRTTTVALERCELCGTALGDAHRHVVEVGRRGVLCACPSCAVLFTSGGRDATYRTIPDRVLVDTRFSLPRDRLGIPVGLAFCYRDSTKEAIVACYPGPAGVVDAELDPDAWSALVKATPLARGLAPDVEALLVDVRPNVQTRCYLVPITSAYELATRLRANWLGFTGGDKVQAELAAFFDELERRGDHV